MRRILPVLLLAGGLSVSMTAAMAEPAAAEQVTLRDARHDVWRSASVDDLSPAPSATLGDVTRTVVAHGPASVVVTLAFVDLRRSMAYSNYTVRLQNGSRQTREVTLEASRHTPGGRIRVFRPNGRVITCAVQHRIDYGRDRVRLSVPRSCLPSSTRVRANVSMHRSNDQGVFFADNPHNQRASSSAWTSWLRAARR